MLVDIDWDAIEIVEDLDKVFKKAIARADEAEEPAIRLEWAEGKGEFYQRKAAKAELSVARQAALEKYPAAREWADEIKGSSATEIEASAKRIHDRLEARDKAQQEVKQKAVEDEAAARAAAQQQYGAPAGAGGGTPIPPALEDGEAIKQRVWGRLGKGMGMQDSQSKLDLPRFSSLRLREAVEAAASPNARYKNPGTDKKVSDDRRK